MENSNLKRINELAAISKTRELTPEETEERAALRQAYLAEFRSSFTEILDNTSIKYPDGKKVKLRKNKEGK